MNINEAIHILQLKRPVTLDAVKKAYRSMALVYHPDVNPDAYSNQQFIALNQAYQLLSSKTEAEINNIHSFKFTKGNRGPIVIPESLIFADIENMFYIYHFLKKFFVFTLFFKSIKTLFNLPKSSSNALKLIQIILGIVFAIIIFPIILLTFIFLTIPYLLYEICYESLKNIYIKRTGLKATKYSKDLLSKLYFLMVRVVPAGIIISITVMVLIYAVSSLNHAIINLYSISISVVLFLWFTSIARDVFISLNQKA